MKYYSRNRSFFYFFQVAWGVMILLFVMSCIPEEKNNKVLELSIDFSDSTYIHILEAGAQKDSAFIYHHLQSENINYQYGALHALTSVDAPINDALIPVFLKSPVSEIRSLAAFVLGQTRDESFLKPLKAAFDNMDSLQKNQRFNATVLEAVGKTGTPKEALELINISTYRPQDSLLNLGRLRGLYQLALNGHELPESRYFMIDVAANALYPLSTRFIAVDYLYRFHDEPIDSLQFGLIRAFQKTESIQLARQLATVLPKCTSAKAREALVELFQDNNRDLLLRELCGQALLDNPHPGHSRYFKEAMDSDVPRISELGARYFLEHGRDHDAIEYSQWASKEGLPLKSQFVLYGAALRHLPFYYQLSKSNISKELRRYLDQPLSFDTRKVLIEMILQDNRNDAFLMEEAINSDDPLLRTQIFTEIQKHYFHPSAPQPKGSKRNQLLSLAQKGIQSGESGAMTISADIAIQLKNNLPKTWSDSGSFIQSAYEAIQWPQQLEAGQKLATLMDSLSLNYQWPNLSEYRSPIITDYLQRMTDSTEWIIAVEGGEIRLRLFPQRAPHTVSRLLQEAEEGYYDGKTVHRVVPHFVSQGGCPIGDGYGGVDFLLPTEVGPVHFSHAGICGMASAGPQTESSQWFITHRATPHLDGRYTIWGEVISGQEILWSMEPGDLIKSVQIKNLNL
jgi:cyclophilin family peptidyl-prolyl cis-trans isomerase/HEAT repeat protein